MNPSLVKQKFCFCRPDFNQLRQVVLWFYYTVLVQYIMKIVNMPSLTGHSTKMTKVVNDYGNLFSTLKAAYEHSFKGIVSRESYDVV